MYICFCFNLYIYAHIMPIYIITGKCYNLTSEIQIPLYGITSKNSKAIETIFYTHLIQYYELSITFMLYFFT